MKNKKAIGLLLALAMIMSFVCPAFAEAALTVTTDKTEYSFGDTVTISGKADKDQMYSISTKVAGAQSIIVLDSFEVTSSGEYKVELKTPDKSSITWPVGTYTVMVGTTKATFKLNESTTTKYAITVNQSSNGTTSADMTKAASSATVTITTSPNSGYAVNKITVSAKDGTTISTSKTANNKYTFTMPAQDVTVTVTYKTTGGGNGGGGVGGIIIPGGTINTGTGTISAVLNENQYSKYGVAASAVSVKASKLSDNTFSVAVAINGTKYTTFTGFDPVMLKVPFTSTASNTNNLVVTDQYGNVVTRALYKDGYVYMAASDISGVFSIVEITKTFSDTNIDWANTAIQALAARNIINGVGGDLYEPENTVTRAQFIKMIVSMFDINDASATSSFADVDASQWYASYVATAKNLGIALGYAEDNTFRPENIITREEMCAMLYRAADVMSVELTSTTTSVTFNDDANIQDYAKTAVYKMQSAGVIQGVGNNTFDAKGSCTRAQAAVAIFNMFKVSMNF